MCVNGRKAWVKWLKGVVMIGGRGLVERRVCIRRGDGREAWEQLEGVYVRVCVRGGEGY